MTIRIETEYSFTNRTEVELPEGKTHDDIADIYVKWGTIYFTFKDESTMECQESEAYFFEQVDWKRPDRVRLLDENYNNIDA